MGDTRLSGNCLLYSRPVLSFDASFDGRPHMQLLRHLFTSVFSIPKARPAALPWLIAPPARHAHHLAPLSQGHPRSKPFHDHVMSFTVVSGQIVIRHYQVASLTSPARPCPTGALESTSGESRGC